MMKTLRASLTGLVVALFVAACGMAPTTLTQENLDKIHEGMGSAQVKMILGAPSDTKTEPIPIVGGTKTTYTYTDGKSNAVIVLKNDEVQSKEGHFSKE